MNVTLAQFNPVVGDVWGNLDKIKSIFIAVGGGLVVFPELSLVGYPPKDLLERGWFVREAASAIRELAKLTRRHPGKGILVGAPVLKSGRLYNCAVLLHRGRVVFTQAKTLLPTYDVFDEARYFRPAGSVRTVRFMGEVLGISVCEDAWSEDGKYSRDPLAELAGKGATVLINIAASPYQVGKDGVRYRLYRRHALRHKVPVVFVNQVGANDELVFDGRSMVFDGKGRLAGMLPAFAEAVETVDLSAPGLVKFVPEDSAEGVYRALVLGVRDYAGKCGFQKAILGLSGGVDSAVTCCIAAEALGAGNVLGVTMPGPYSSAGSVEDSKRLALNLGVGFREVPITDIYDEFVASLDGHFKGAGPDKAEENLQARIRGNILMALSNKFGHLVLSTGNKSEFAVGYCTLYGDMSGGLAVISDVPKTMVYRLAEHVNRGGDVIPRAIIEKAPSAELKPGQRDQDTLPPYGVLDEIIRHYVDGSLSREQIIRKGFDKATVEWVADAVDGSEYKRRQAPPGLKVTSKAFGVGRRMPIAAKYSR